MPPRDHDDHPRSDQREAGPNDQSFGGMGESPRVWADRREGGYSGGVDAGYGTQGGSGGFGPLSQGSVYAQHGASWGRSGYGGGGSSAGRRSQGGGTYGQQDVSPASQRSHLRDEQFGQDRPSGYGYDQSGPGGPADHDHEPGYIHWRRTQLESHDRDYRRWRDEQARKYDEEYGQFRTQRHEGFSREFHSWRSGQGTAASQPTGGTTPLTESSDPVESVTDGSAHTHEHDKA